MELTDPREIQTALSKPFAPEDLEWRLQQTFEDKMRGNGRILRKRSRP